MPKPHIATIGKVVRKITRLKGGGSAFPGLVIEKIDPYFTRDVLNSLPYGTVIISGTNGKTTTTKMTVELLESQGLKVFTNRTGSNFSRGVTAAILESIDYKGHLDADIAVLELDEAHAVRFVKVIKPRFSLLLNVMRDQLDRFGEIDTTARMLQAIAEATSETVVFNREDPRIAAIAPTLDSATHKEFFGLEASLRSQFPSDDDMRRAVADKNVEEASVILKAFDSKGATFSINGSDVTTPLKLSGIYNIYNAASALALTRAVMGAKLNQPKLIESLAQITPAFGRGEVVTLNNQPVELVLVKNPGGFRLALKSFSPEGYVTMIAINDNYADGRDMSWLWDVDFDSLRPHGVAEISGVRAYDMALRMQYDEVEVSHVETDLEAALDYFVSQHPDSPKRIYCTYTAMLKLRKLLAKKTDVEEVL